MTTPLSTDPGHVCANCGALAPERYCPQCGQDTRERVPTFRQFMREATGRYLAFDGKLWKTLVPLLFRPGFLTVAYFAGRRRRYIGPARLFLVSSLVLFAVLRFAADVVEIDGIASADALDAKAAAKERSRPASGDLVVLDDDLNLRIGEFPGKQGLLGKPLARFNSLSRAQKQEQIVAGTLRYGPYAMFVLLPAFGLLLKLVYLGSRRRRPARPRLYGEHLVFSAHDHAFVFVAGTLLSVIPVGVVRAGILLWICVYFALSMRAVYGGSWAGIAVRGAALFIVYLVLFGVVTMGLLIAAILLR
jgi:hypothetical protein